MSYISCRKCVVSHTSMRVIWKWSLLWFVVIIVCGRCCCGRYCHGLHPDSLLRLWHCINHSVTYLLTCGRHCLWPSLCVAVIVMVCGRHCLWLSLLCPSLSYFVAVIVVAIIVMVYGRHRLWPSLFMAVIAVALIVMVYGRHCLWWSLSNPFCVMFWQWDADAVLKCRPTWQASILIVKGDEFNRRREERWDHCVTSDV